MPEPAFFSHDGLPQWQKNIIFRYPDIYLTPSEANTSHDIEGDDSFCNLRMGFEFDQGWKGLAEAFSGVADQLVKRLRQSRLQPDAFIRAFVFKEKLGTLRWQGTHNLIEPFATLFGSHVDQLPVRSVHICELTGQPGELREIHGMWKTLCNREYKRLLNKRACSRTGTSRQKG